MKRWLWPALAGLAAAAPLPAEEPKPAFTLEGHTGDVLSVAFSPDGKTLASASADRSIKLWNTATGESLRTIEGHIDNVLAVAFSPDGKALASGSSDKTVRLWNAATGDEVGLLDGHTEAVTCVAFMPDGTTLASVWGPIGEFKLWNVADRKATAGFNPHFKGGLRVAAIAPDGKTIALASFSDRKITLWDVSVPKEPGK